MQQQIGQWLKSWMEKANGEIAASKAVETETKSAMEKLSTKAAELTDKCLELERKLSDSAKEGQKASESIGEQLVKSDAFQAMAQGLGGVVSQTGNSEYGRTDLSAQGSSKTFSSLPESQKIHLDSLFQDPLSF